MIQNKKYWNSIAEIVCTFRQYVWLYCATFSLGCEGGGGSIVRPCTPIDFNILKYFSPLIMNLKHMVIIYTNNVYSLHGWEEEIITMWNLHLQLRQQIKWTICVVIKGNVSHGVNNESLHSIAALPVNQSLSCNSLLF